MAARKKGRNPSSKPRAKKKAAKRKSVPQSADGPSGTNPLREIARAFAAQQLR